MAKVKAKKRAAQASPRKRRPVGQPYPYELRLQVVQAVVEGGATAKGAARAFKINPAEVYNWVERYEAGGPDALRPAERKRARRRADTSAATTRRTAVIATKREHPEWGTRRIEQVLARFAGLGVDEHEVRRILHDEGLIEARPSRPAREHPVRRFERAEPNQLWQSDIFTFLLRRHERLYVAAFMDDHSRFLVSHALAHHQKSELVMEALERGIASYGAPREILTDQGRQYTAWRGETDFERALRREGIAHVKSRPQHPQTLGKVERFWKTLWDEMLSRTVFADFADCERRLGLFIQAYNFRRPHQALDGLVPADRFFRAAPQVRAAIERTVEDNALRMALERPTRQPFYLVGRLGDRDLSIAASGGGLEVKVGEEEPRRIDLPKEERDAEQPSTNEGRFRSGHEEVESDGAVGAGRRAAQASQSSGAAVADGVLGARRDRAATVPDDPERAVGLIEVVTPGVMRGFDAMHVATADGTRWLLVASDAAVPYRTSMVLATRYDAQSVLRAIEADIAANGAPLVWRMDRASAHRVPDVVELLASHGVLVLHGPARCPRFYGQLERQNREHRPLLQQLGELPRAAAVERYLPEMQRVLNETWPRRALDWRVPAGLWTTRPALSEDRDELHAHVQQRAARIAARIGDGRSVAELANRIAIEEALIERGYLRRPAETVLIGIQC